MDQTRIRNFSIIAHIDHGKSTLADRVLELTDTVTGREMREQVLDSMELERERGITIKAQAVRVIWKGHQLNLIDTPGHVDFTYEVSRSLVFDSAYDQYRGVLAFVRVVDGVFRRRDALRAMAEGSRLEAEELGFFSPTMRASETLSAGEVGYVVTGLKDVSRLRVGDTLTTQPRPASQPLPGYKEVKPMVFSGLFPSDSDEYPE